MSAQTQTSRSTDVAEVSVHCAGGYRASVAASMLDVSGRSLVAIDNAEHVCLRLRGPAA